MGQEIDRVMDEITPAASPSCPLGVLLGDLIEHGQGRSGWRAEGAPLMIVKKILTASVSHPALGRHPAAGSFGSRCYTECRRDLWALGVSQPAPNRATM
jgi:hypothetical protein